MISKSSNKPLSNILLSVGTAFFYGFCSSSLTIFNKAVFTTYGFPYSKGLLGVQLSFTIVILLTMRKISLISFPDISFKEMKPLFPIGILYSINVIIALEALKFLNLPMYSVLKRLTICLVLFGEYLLFGKKSSSQVKLSVFLIVGGALIAGLGDLQFDIYGYLSAFFSCTVQCLYLLYVAKSGIESGLNSFGLVFYNSLISLPFLSLYIVLSGEINEMKDWMEIHLIETPEFDSIGFLICFFTSIVFGSLLNYSIFLCTTTNSALTTTIVGQIKGVIPIVAGLIFFGGIKMNLLNSIGLVSNTIGGFYYSYAKYQEKIVLLQPHKPKEVSKNEEDKVV